MVQTNGFQSKAVAVKCAPNFQLGGLNVPLGAAPGQNGSSYDVKMTGGGLELQRHKERHLQRTEHREERESVTRRDDKDPEHMSESESESTRIHDSQESVQQTEDSGVKLGWSGVQLYNDTSDVADRTAADTETGRTRNRTMDKSVNGTRLSSSGSEYSRRSTSREHHEARQHTGLDLNGDFIKHMDVFANANVGDMSNNIGIEGSGDVLSKTGRGKGGNATRETTTLDTHEGTLEERGRSWNKTKDYVKDGNQTSVIISDQASNHTAVSKESSKNETHEKENKMIKGDDEKDNEQMKNDGQSTDGRVTNADRQDKSNTQQNIEPCTSDGQQENETQSTSIHGQNEIEKTNKE